MAESAAWQQLSAWFRSSYRLLLVLLLMWKSFSRSPHTSAKKYYLDGFKEDQRIQKRSDVFDIVQIIAQLLDGILNRSSIRIADLGPTGQPRPDEMPFRIIGDNLF